MTHVRIYSGSPRLRTKTANWNQRNPVSTHLDTKAGEEEERKADQTLEYLVLKVASTNAKICAERAINVPTKLSPNKVCENDDRGFRRGNDGYADRCEHVERERK